MRVTARLSLAAASLISAACIWALATSPAARADDASFSGAQEQAIEEIVRNYLLENPTLMLEVFDRLETIRAEEERATSQAAIAANQSLLTNDGYSHVFGNPDGDITIVEFFDYKCPYCKRAVADILAAVSEDGNVRLVLKEFPILSEESELAAKAALAAERQGKYMSLHMALMGTSGSLDRSRILRIAADLDIDTDQLEEDMASAEIEAAIAETHELARQIGVEGTPAFIIGSQLVPGAVSKERLLEVVEEERSGCVSC